MTNRFNLTHQAASEAILAAVTQSRLVQASWHSKDGQGREVACLLGSMHPEITSPSDCNGDLMPLWFARVVPDMFDGISPDDIYQVATRFGLLVAQWHVLTPGQWGTVKAKYLAKCIDMALAGATRSSKSSPCWDRVNSICLLAKKNILDNSPWTDVFIYELANVRSYTQSIRNETIVRVAEFALAAHNGDGVGGTTAATLRASDDYNTTLYLIMFHTILDLIQEEITKSPT